jgi:hypothetical protein
MKKQTKSNLQTSLQSLGIVFLILFGMAFSCGDDQSPSPPNNNGKILTERNNSGGSCSTKAEFLGIVKRDRLKIITSTSGADLKPPEFILESSDVAAPITYSTVYTNKVLKIYPAYPVTLGWTERTFRYNTIKESEYDGGLFYCYKNPEDYGEKFVPEDPRFPKDACVCIGQNLQAGFSAVKERECPYDEDEPNKTCPGN